MSYCTQSDIENLFGTDNVLRWSNLDNNANAVDASRIASAIAYADAYIDDRFRGSRFAVPLTGLHGLPQITDLAARLAGVWLYESRGADDVDEAGRPVNKQEFHREYVNRQIRRYLAGMDTLPANHRYGAQPTVPVVVKC